MSHGIDDRTRQKFSRLLLVEDRSGCWLFRRASKHCPYGRFVMNGHQEQAHRAAWMLLVGPIPVGMKVLHTCDTPACCNPAHLFIGTQADNMQDCAKKGRRTCNPARGAMHGHSTLTANDVLKIKAALADGNEAQWRIAKRFGTSQMTVSNIKRSVHWGARA